MHLPVPIIAVSANERTCQNLQFSYGVIPVHVQKGAGFLGRLGKPMGTKEPSSWFIRNSHGESAHCRRVQQSSDRDHLPVKPPEEDL
jgi:hypothetical protein